MQRSATRNAADLGAGLAVIEPESRPVPPASGPVPRPQRPHASDVLAQLMDFPGGMKVAEQLEADPPARPRHPAAAQLGWRLERDVEARMEALERNAMAPLNGLRAPRLPTAEALHETYRAAGLEAGREATALERFSEMAGQPLLSAMGASIRQSQIQLGTLRWEIQDSLRELGPTAERIERLDGVLHTATQARARDAFERIEFSLTETWSAACRHALGELPAEPEISDFAAWVAPDGWLERFRGRCVQGAQAVFTHLRRNLRGTLHAAVIAEES